MPNSNIVPGISNPSKDIVVFRQSERPTVVERTRPAFWYNTSNSGTYFWDTKLDDWVPISASNVITTSTTTTTTTTTTTMPSCASDWTTSTTSLDLKASWNNIITHNGTLYLYFLQNGYLFQKQSSDGINWFDNRMVCSIANTSSIIKSIKKIPLGSGF